MQTEWRPLSDRPVAERSAIFGCAFQNSTSWPSTYSLGELACAQVHSAGGQRIACGSAYLTHSSSECVAVAEPLRLQTIGFRGQEGADHEIRFGLAGGCECVGNHAGLLRRKRTWSKPGIIRQHLHGGIDPK